MEKSANFCLSLLYNFLFFWSAHLANFFVYFLANRLQVSFSCPSEGNQQLGGTSAPGGHHVSPQRWGWNPRGSLHRARELGHAAVLAAQLQTWQHMHCIPSLPGRLQSPRVFFLALTVVHNGLCFCLMLSGSWWGCHRWFEDFSGNQSAIMLSSSHCSCHCSLVTSQVWA